MEVEKTGVTNILFGGETKLQILAKQNLHFPFRPKKWLTVQSELGFGQHHVRIDHE